MNILERFFPGKKSVEAVSEVVTADELVRLAESNPAVVGAQLTTFEAQITELKQHAKRGDGMEPIDWNRVKQLANLAADALRGYGIMVSPDAFIEVAEGITI